MALWLLQLVSGSWYSVALWGPGSLGHAHEMLLGVGSAALMGFLLTAVPEFTATAAFASHQVRALWVLWALARLASLAYGVVGAWAWAVGAAAQCAALGGTLVLVAPRLWRDPSRRHRAFVYALGAFCLVTVGFYATHISTGGDSGRWLRALLGVYMVLVVLAASRISMTVVNRALSERGEAADYLARPPRRNLAVATIILFTLVHGLDGAPRVQGWLAWAAAAALLNLLNDWHVGWALWRRWPFMLYLVYVGMAVGYGLIGADALFGWPLASAGWHALGIVGLGLSVFAVFCIAGRTHAGLDLDERLWVPGGVLALLGAGLLRALAGNAALGLWAWLGAGALWMAAFGAVLWRLGQVWWARRSDGRTGCAGPGEAGAQEGGHEQACGQV